MGTANTEWPTFDLPPPRVQSASTEERHLGLLAVLPRRTAVFLRVGSERALGREQGGGLSHALAIGASANSEGEQDEVIELVVPARRAGERREWVRVVRRGTPFAFKNGGHVELFRIGAFAEALHRTRYTIVEWEKSGWISPPSFVVHGHGRERWRYYSGQQVVNANKLLVQRYDGRRRFGSAAQLRDFLRELDREMARGAAARDWSKNGLVPRCA